MSQYECEKIKCLLNYFMRFFSAKDAETHAQAGQLIFSRRVVAESAVPDWLDAGLDSSAQAEGRRPGKPLTDFSVSDGGIESHGLGMLQADFANEAIGGTCSLIVRLLALSWILFKFFVFFWLALGGWVRGGGGIWILIF
jgi:hypothetical protein